jgi:tubulin alpha
MVCTEFYFRSNPQLSTRNNSVLTFQREVVSLHMGQAGVQIGNACWELYGIEHGVSPDGFLTADDLLCNSHDFFDTFYQETSARRYVPRAIFADLEPSVIGTVHAS